MTPCTCDKWMEDSEVPTQRFLVTHNLDIEAALRVWLYCPWCSASLSGSEKPREEQCVKCSLMVTDWVDTDWSQGRICRECESKHDPAKQKPMEEAEWRVMGPHEKPDKKSGDAYISGDGIWRTTFYDGSHEIRFITSDSNAKTYRTKRPLPTQPEE